MGLTVFQKWLAIECPANAGVEDAGFARQNAYGEDFQRRDFLVCRRTE